MWMLVWRGGMAWTSIMFATGPEVCMYLVLLMFLFYTRVVIPPRRTVFTRSGHDVAQCHRLIPLSFLPHSMCCVKYGSLVLCPPSHLPGRLPAPFHLYVQYVTVGKHERHLCRQLVLQQAPALSAAADETLQPAASVAAAPGDALLPPSPPPPPPLPPSPLLRPTAPEPPFTHTPIPERTIEQPRPPHAAPPPRRPLPPRQRQ